MLQGRTGSEVPISGFDADALNADLAEPVPNPHPQPKKVKKDPNPNESNSKDIDLMKVLYIQAKEEMKIEELRMKLVKETKDFNTVDAFRLIDVTGKGRVNEHELKLGMEMQDLDFTIDEMLSFIHKYSKNSAMMRIKYSEFCDAFAPKDKAAIAELASRVP